MARRGTCGHTITEREARRQGDGGVRRRGDGRVGRGESAAVGCGRGRGARRAEAGGVGDWGLRGAERTAYLAMAADHAPRARAGPCGAVPAALSQQTRQLRREDARGSHDIAPVGPSGEPPIAACPPVPTRIPLSLVPTCVPHASVELEQQPLLREGPIMTTGPGVVLADSLGQPVRTNDTAQEADLKHAFSAAADVGQDVPQIAPEPVAGATTESAGDRRRRGEVRGTGSRDQADGALDGDAGHVGAVEDRVLDGRPPRPGELVHPLLEMPRAVDREAVESHRALRRDAHVHLGGVSGQSVQVCRAPVRQGGGLTHCE